MADPAVRLSSGVTSVRPCTHVIGVAQQMGAAPFDIGKRPVGAVGRKIECRLPPNLGH